MILRNSAEFLSGHYDNYDSSALLSFIADIRSQSRNEHNCSFICPICKKPLRIDGGKEGGYKCVHFKHKFPSPDCPYHDSKQLTEREITAIIFNGRTEGRHHRHIKDVISTVLRSEADIINVEVEKVITKIDKSWRKPDIFAQFIDKEIAFEVQISPIFYHIITERTDAYRNSGKFILWVFDDVNEDHPLMRHIDVFAINNYNLFAFDESAQQATAYSGRLHLNVKYFSFRIVNNKISGEWTTKIVPFSELTFDTDSYTIYYHDSNTEKLQCEQQIKEIEYKQSQIEIIDRFLCCISESDFPDKYFRLIEDYFSDISEDAIYLGLADAKYYAKSLSADALNKWLVVACRDNNPKYARFFWDIVKDKFPPRSIKYLTIADCINLIDSSEIVKYLHLFFHPFDIQTSIIIDQLSKKYCDEIKGNNDFTYSLSLLIILNRYYTSTKHQIPQHIISFFSSCTKQIFCLISAQWGKPYGFQFANLKGVANYIYCNHDYHSIAPLFLYLIERNGFVNRISSLIPQKNHYLRLKQLEQYECMPLSIHDMDILFPKK